MERALMKCPLEERFEMVIAQETKKFTCCDCSESSGETHRTKVMVTTHIAKLQRKCSHYILAEPTSNFRVDRNESEESCGCEVEDIESDEPAE